jgi:hypothetical protein
MVNSLGHFLAVLKKAQVNKVELVAELVLLKHPRQAQRDVVRTIGLI